LPGRAPQFTPAIQYLGGTHVTNILCRPDNPTTNFPTNHHRLAVNIRKVFLFYAASVYGGSHFARREQRPWCMLKLVSLPLEHNRRPIILVENFLFMTLKSKKKTHMTTTTTVAAASKKGRAPEWSEDYNKIIDPPFKWQKPYCPYFSLPILPRTGLWSICFIVFYFRIKTSKIKLNLHTSLRKTLHYDYIHKALGCYQMGQK
jgi:hypothetical protein